MIGMEKLYIRNRKKIPLIINKPNCRALYFSNLPKIAKADGRILCAIRVRKGVAESFSSDGGYTWSDPVLSETIQKHL